MPDMRAIGAKALGLVASALLATTLVACGATEQSPAPEPESVESAETDVDAVDESEDASDDTEASQPTPTTVEVNQSVTDEELGYTITLKQAIVDIPFDDANIWADGYRTGVCVEVELTNNSEYVATLRGTDLYLLVDGEEVDTSMSRISTFQTFADDNGLTALPSEGAGQGETISGWLFYYFDTGSGDNELALRYARMETEVSVIGGPEGGSSYTIPAEDFDIAF